MSNWGLWTGAGPAESDARVAASSRGIAVTCGNGAEGSYTQLIASTARDSHLLLLWVWLASNTRSAAIDIAVGGAGSEQVIVQDIRVSRPFDANTAGPTCCIPIPISIPAGTRVSARGYGSAGVDAYVSVTLLATGYLGLAPYHRATSYGGSGAYGVQIDAGATANTKGSYGEIVASTTYPIHLLYLIPNSSASGDHVGGTGTYLVDLAIGAGGSEQIILADLVVLKQAPYAPVIGPIPVSIPAGTRIAARAQCSVTTTGVRTFGLTILGLD